MDPKNFKHLYKINEQQKLCRKRDNILVLTTTREKNARNSKVFKYERKNAKERKIKWIAHGDQQILAAVTKRKSPVEGQYWTKHALRKLIFHT